MVIIVMGVSGSGKTTIAKILAEKLGWPFFDGDDFHPPENITRMGLGIPLTDQDRQSWLIALASHIADIQNSNTSAVLACSALKQSYRNLLRTDPRVYFIYLKGDYEQILTRMQKRGDHFMKPDMLKSQFAALEEPDDAICVDISLSPEQIINQLLSRIVILIDGQD